MTRERSLAREDDEKEPSFQFHTTSMSSLNGDHTHTLTTEI